MLCKYRSWKWRFTWCLLIVIAITFGLVHYSNYNYERIQANRVETKNSTHVVISHVTSQRVAATISASADQRLKQHIVRIRMENGNCRAILQGNEDELLKAEILQDNNIALPTSSPSESNSSQFSQISNTGMNNAAQLVFDNLTSPGTDCSKDVHIPSYITDSVTKEEQEFPLAFEIQIYKDARQVERLLRAIYRPQNYYCIHVDNSSSDDFKMAISAIAVCFDNVIIPSRTVNVKWGEYSVLEADLICMQTLLRYGKWKYLINLTGQEFPLKTNLQMVRILKMFKGANDITGSIRRLIARRTSHSGDPPHSLQLRKGSMHIAASRSFVEFIFTEPKVHDFLDWVKGTRVPDETFFSTLNFNPQFGVPGAFNGSVELMEERPHVARHKIWTDSNKPCHGKYLRKVCVYDVRDLSVLVESRSLFANKFIADFAPLAYDCMEEWHRNRTIDEYRDEYNFDLSWYRTFVSKYLRG